MSNGQPALHDVEHPQVNGFRLAPERAFHYVHRVIIGKYRGGDKARKQSQDYDEHKVDKDGHDIEVAYDVNLGVEQFDCGRLYGFGKEEAYDKRNQCEQC